MAHAARSLWNAVMHADPFLLTAFAIALLARAVAFPSIPPGFNQDEASTAYDAYAILKEGIDRHGFSFPLVLAAWGSGMQALPAYLQIPFMALFRNTIFAARLPSLLLGLASIPLLYRIVREAINQPTARIAAFLLAVAPGHIMLSRWAHEASFFPGIFLIALTLLILSFKQPKYLSWAAYIFGLTLYTYATAYLVVPVFLLFTGIYVFIHRPWPWKKMVQAIVIFAITALPLALYLIINTFDLPSLTTPLFSIPNLPSQPRYETMASYQSAFGNLKTGWNLLKTQDDGLIWNVIPRFGIVYLFSLPLVLLGAGLLVERTIKRRFDPATILMIWCITCIVLAAFTSINVNRANIAIIPLVFCIAIALAYLRNLPWIFWPLAAAYVLSFAQFTSFYFGQYKEEAAGAFFASLPEALQEAARQTDGPICVTGNVNMPYIFALYHNGESPLEFVKTVEYDNPGAEFQSASSFGRYTFGLDRCSGATYGAYVVHRDERSQFAVGSYRVIDFDLYSVAVPL